MQSDSCGLLGDIELQRLAALPPSPATEVGEDRGMYMKLWYMRVEFASLVCRDLTVTQSKC